MEKRLFTSESVTEGHPDKVCDAISDAILDACLAEDPMSRVACETASCTGFVLVTGEITTKAKLDVPAIVRKTVNEIGYNDAKTGFDGNTCAVMVALDQQSPDIAMGVDKALEAKVAEHKEETNILNSIIKTAHRWYPDFANLLRLERLAKQFGLSAMDFAELIKGRGLNFTGRLFSSEHNRWFATDKPLYRFCEITISDLP